MAGQTQTTMILLATPSDLEWLKKKIREDFDQPREWYQFEQYQFLIEMCERWGLFELAQELERDIAYPKIKQ